MLKHFIILLSLIFMMSFAHSNSRMMQEKFHSYQNKFSDTIVSQKKKRELKFYISGGFGISYLKFLYNVYDLLDHYPGYYQNKWDSTGLPKGYLNLKNNQEYQYANISIATDVQWRGFVTRFSFSKFLFSISPSLKSIGDKKYGILPTDVWIGYSNRYKNKDQFFSVMFIFPVLNGGIASMIYYLLGDPVYNFSSQPTDVQIYLSYKSYFKLLAEGGWRLNKKCYFGLECTLVRGSSSYYQPETLIITPSIKFYYLLNKIK